ncbi:VOC family protein, partial [Ruegeria sp. 2205SS24-7]|uniref:VOC family protein n=1 Tax=Ruegeria discodermiae TaxID=3064389 RepID=UPI0027428941
LPDAYRHSDRLIWVKERDPVRRYSLCMLEDHSMPQREAGQIVWHDLFTEDAALSRCFYEKVARWRYVIEHATDFAWGGGERDFILALSEDEAGAGFVAANGGPPFGWLPYVEVQDVDAAAEMVLELCGTVEKAPFDVPGVGRNCLVRDPIGAHFGICQSRHAFPVPTRQFGPEHYLATASEFPADFYSRLLNWSIVPLDASESVSQLIVREETNVGYRTESASQSDHGPVWVPSIRVAQIAEALQGLQEIEGTVLSREIGSGSALVADPNGALSVLF